MTPTTATAPLNVLSLCSGYGGLDLAVEAIFDAVTVAHAEFEEAPSKVLAARWPGVPNLGDIKTIDWDAVAQMLIDIFTAGYPCQPFSLGGKRKGHDDERHLWPAIFEGIRRVRPRIVVLENVAGHRTLGLDTVLGDLASSGYDASWTSIRAADIGATHGRERIFILATDTRGETVRLGPGLCASGPARQWRGRPDDDPAPDAADTTGYGRNEGRSESHGNHSSPGERGARDVERVHGLGTAPDPHHDTARNGRERGDTTVGWAESAQQRAEAPTDAERSRRAGRSSDARGCALGGTPTAWCGPVDRADVFAGRWCACEVAPHSDSDGRESERRVDAERRDADRRSGPDITWGAYEPAIRRWEAALGRLAPAPTETGPKGGQRLSPRFVEWMMGLPAGWVTDITGISRNALLKMLGNGVVPQQAYAAIATLVDVMNAAA